MSPRKKNASDKETAQQRLMLNLEDAQAVVSFLQDIIEEELQEEALEEALSDHLTPACYTVSEITRHIQTLLEEDPVLGRSVVIRGELSNVKRSSRGHIYFTLKDESACLNGVIWAGLSRSLPFKPENGLDVYVTGTIEIYPPNGTYSIVASKIEPVGVGALQLAFRQIKERLEAEGLFRDEFKKPLPYFPRKIGIVTSRTGAVIHDMLRVIQRKNPMVDVLIAPVKVQGEDASVEIATAIRELNQAHYGLDVLIVARGGGSFEDLFCFSEEPVVRAIFESHVPIITGIGHEPDFSLADAAADYSAATPTMAAETAVPDLEAWLETVKQWQQELGHGLSQQLRIAEQRLDLAATQLVDQFNRLLEDSRRDLEQRKERLNFLFEQVFAQTQQRFTCAASELHAFSPLATLSRGYAIVTATDGKVIKSAKRVTAGETLRVKLMEGQLHCEVLSNDKES